MDAKEKKELIDKILNADSEPKMARVSATVFVNKASNEEAAFFLDYLDHSSTATRKLIRNILGQMGIVEAADKLITEFYTATDALTFMPDAEREENTYYKNIIEILETLFLIIKSKKLQKKEFFDKLDGIFKYTKNEDLRFTMIKLIAVLGDRYEYFMKIFEDLTEKEKKALYYVYTFVDDTRRLKLYGRAIEEDEKNLDYVISNLLTFPEGIEYLCKELPALSNYNKQVVLKKLQQSKHPEFNDVLIQILSDKNKFLVELAIDILKRNITAGVSLDPFINLIETGYSPEGISGAMEIIAHFVKKNPEDIYLQGLEKQPSHKNKTLILDFLIEKLKTDIDNSEEFTEKVLPKMLTYFDNHTKEKEDLLTSIFKIIGHMKYSNSGKLKGLKSKMVGYAKTFDNRFSNTFKNNFKECLVRLNQMIGRFEESESKMKQIVVLFDIDHTSIDHDRMMKLKDQLNQIDHFDQKTKARFVDFRADLAGTPKIDWKVKTVSLELLSEYGGLAQIPVIKKVIETESSLAVKTNAQKALKNIEEKYADDILTIFIMEPLPYLEKKLSAFFLANVFKVRTLGKDEKFSEIIEEDIEFKYLVVSESLFSPEFSQEIFDYMDEHFETSLIILTANLDKWDSYKELPNVKLLKKPFNDDSLKAAISE
ncbi:MAG: hypothetical protein GY757_08445 [bacterium]|nr:hypothetical protein [bacterium]